MNTNETTNENELTPSEEPEITPNEELSDEELETVDGGLLPAVQNQISSVVATKQQSHGIIAVLIGL